MRRLAFDVSGCQLEEAGMMTHDPDQLVELTIFEHEFIAQLLVDRLRENAVKADVFALAGEQLGLLSASTAPHAGAQVRVRAADLELAERILGEFNAEAALRNEGGETETAGD